MKTFEKKFEQKEEEMEVQNVEEQNVEEQIQDAIEKTKKEIESKTMPLFGKQINMGNITPEEYNDIVKRVGNKFINSMTGDIFCPCGKFHSIKKSISKKTIECSTFNFLVKAATKPKVYEKWIKLVISFYKDVEKMTEQIADKELDTKDVDK